MNFKIAYNQLLKLLPQSVVDGSLKLSNLNSIASLERAVEGDISFLGNSKYKSLVSKSNASVILLPKDYFGSPKDNQVFIRMDEPSRGLASLCSHLETQLYPTPVAEIHSTAWVDSTAKLGVGVTVGAFSFIGKDASIDDHAKIGSHCHIGDYAKIGRNSNLHPGVKLLSRCELGKEVIVNAGVVIGSEGFGFDQVGGTHKKIPHLGRVVIEDYVEIGANTCVDRARFEETRIGAGSKIDNLVQIGHNVRIGKDCLIVAQVGIAGSVEFEDNVVVGGQAGFAGHLKIGKGAKIAGQAGITKNVDPGAFLKGNPALPFQLAQRISILQKRLPDLFNRFDGIADKE
ncbi:MAG: UDP-3-O-(3-hydroxymyristoyl)glucosamine N-acyltransferase [Opitutae bacterium]